MCIIFALKSDDDDDHDYGGGCCSIIIYLAKFCTFNMGEQASIEERPYGDGTLFIQGGSQPCRVCVACCGPRGESPM